MFRKFLFLAWLLAFVKANAHAQYYFYNDKYYNSPFLLEAGVSVGGFNCLTDLGGGKGHGKAFIKDLNLKNTHPGGGVYVSILFDQLFGFRAEASFGKISASDNVLKDDQSVAKNRYNRNLHFESNISEISLLAELLPFSLLSSESYPLFSPYLLAGVGLFKFNPKAVYKGKWIELKPLKTEGQGFKQSPRESYELTQVNFPIGLGVKYEISALCTGRVEMIYRFLKTDYLDDVSTQYINASRFYSNLNLSDARMASSLADRTNELLPGVFHQEGEIRGNPENKDAYFSFNIKLGLYLNRKRR